jgi:cytochrome P450
MGLHLAKLETRIALNKLLDRLPGLRFDHDRVRALDAHMRGKAFRSPTALPVLWDS